MYAHATRRGSVSIYVRESRLRAPTLRTVTGAQSGGGARHLSGCCAPLVYRRPSLGAGRVVLRPFNGQVRLVQCIERETHAYIRTFLRTRVRQVVVLPLSRIYSYVETRVFSLASNVRHNFFRFFSSVFEHVKVRARTPASVPWMCAVRKPVVRKETCVSRAGGQRLRQRRGTRCT